MAAAPAPPALDLGFGWDWDTPAIALRALREAGCSVRDTSDESLAQCGHPLAELFREYRALKKRSTTYGPAWLQHMDGGRRMPSGGRSARRPAGWRARIPAYSKCPVIPGFAPASLQPRGDCW
jgi:hypothetical protein